MRGPDAIRTDGVRCLRAEWDDDEAAAPGLHVTLTRATQAVVVLHARELPAYALPLLAS